LPLRDSAGARVPLIWSAAAMLPLRKHGLRLKILWTAEACLRFYLQTSGVCETPEV